MKKSICFLIGLIIFSFSQLTAQDYKAVTYWKMEHDPEYVRIIQKQNSGELLSDQEQVFLTDHKVRLTEYFEKMDDNEKSLYFKNRIKWSAQPGTIDKTSPNQEIDVYSGERSKYSQYLVSSGIFGFIYGSSAASVFNMQNGGAAALPLLAAGASTIIPMLTIKDKNVSYNSLALSIHGKTIGALQGAALSLLITGTDASNGKILLTLSTVSSIALGREGFVLGRDKPWSQGRAALYSHYGLLMPFEGLAVVAAFGSENPRIYAASSLVFGAGGYLIADRVSNRNDFTLGDITATSTLSTINGLLGFAIASDIASNRYEFDNSFFLIPAIGALGGTFAAHYWLKDARLTNQQGRNAALATTGGSIIGLGLTALVSPASATPYYITGYLTGITAYAITVGKYKKINSTARIETDDKSQWNIRVMPQNLYFNRQIASYALANPQKRVNFLPAFSATCNF